MTGLDRSLPRIAVLGAGHVGPIVARLAAEAGYPVSIAASGDPEDIALTIQVLAPGVVPDWAADAVAGADVVVLAIPLHRLGGLDPNLLAGKVVVDMMNYWPEVNGVLADFERADIGSSELVARRLARSCVVKTLNHLGYHQIDEESRPAGDPDRRALGIAGDDPAAVALVSELVERIGFDPVPVGGLAAGRLLEPTGPVFGTPMRRREFARTLGGVAA
jgi:predicted dinucleotide-binding enzyme